MKAVLISINPQWCDLIASLKKTIEIRKTKPNLKTPFKVYIYCTQDKYVEFVNHNNWRGNGKVIGEFICKSTSIFRPKSITCESSIKKASCLTVQALIDYAGYKEHIFGWHISDLKIYDKPKELSEFYGKCNEGCEDCYLWQNVRVNSEEFDMDCSSKYYGHIPLKRPPQSWCYIESVGV